MFFLRSMRWGLFSSGCLPQRSRTAAGRPTCGKTTTGCQRSHGAATPGDGHGTGHDSSTFLCMRASAPVELSSSSYSLMHNATDDARKPRDSGWCGFWRSALLREYAAVAFLVALYLVLTNTVSSPKLFIPNANTPNITVAELQKLDPYIGFPLLDDTVPSWVVALLMVLPLPLLGLYFSMPKHSLFEFHAAVMVMIETQVTQLFFTDLGKLMASRYRPDYLARCASIDALGNCVPFDAKSEKDGHHSFPSGHSSGSFSGMVLLALYLAGKLRLHRGRRAYWKLIVCAAPVFLAWWIAISRTVDYHHNYSDVLAGACVGSAAAWVCYYMQYPRLDAPHCDEPLPIDVDDDADDADGGSASEAQAPRAVRHAAVPQDFSA